MIIRKGYCKTGTAPPSRVTVVTNDTPVMNINIYSFIIWKLRFSIFFDRLDPYPVTCFCPKMLIPFFITLLLFSLNLYL